MALTLRDVVKKLFVNGYMWTGNVTKDKALNWAKSCVVQPTGTVAKSAANGAIPITNACVTLTTGAASAYTLANGTNGQVLVMVVVTDGGAGTVTPVTATGWATAVFTDDIDTLSVMYVDDTVGWVVLGNAGDGTNLVALTQ